MSRPARYPQTAHGKIESEKQGRRPGEAMQALNALIEMQKRFVNTWESSNARSDRIDTEMVKVNRRIMKLHEDQAAFRSDITAHVEALAGRMNESEKPT